MLLKSHLKTTSLRVISLSLVHTNDHNSHPLSKVICCHSVLICRLKCFQIWECHFCLSHLYANNRQTFLDIKKTIDKIFTQAND